MRNSHQLYESNIMNMEISPDMRTEGTNSQRNVSSWFRALVSNVLPNTENMKKTFLWIVIITLFGCNSNIDKNDYLRKVTKNLDKIKSASYFVTESASAPGDTAKFSEPRVRFYKIFINPSDTLVGSSSAIFSAKDTTKMTDFYNGTVRGTVNWDEQFVKIDSFKNHPYPFRLVYYPFYTKINEIIKYTLTTTDSIRTDFRDYGDSVFFSLKIINKHVYFHIRPIVIKNEYIPEDEISQFDIWFNKKDYLPYRMRSKWHHTTFFESSHNAKFNFNADTSLIESYYFPSHFEVRYVDPYAPKQEVQKESLAGKIAPDWQLKDIDYKNVKLSDLKSKVILIQFTGVGCGPCHHSIPFLKQLVEEYETKDFEFISIETWSNNIEGLKRYQQNNGLNFKFLKATDEVTKAYNVSSVPVFFIIDENRIVRKIINGYSKEITDKEIIESIDKYL